MCVKLADRQQVNVNVNQVIVIISHLGLCGENFFYCFILFDFMVDKLLS